MTSKCPVTGHLMPTGVWMADLFVRRDWWRLEQQAWESWEKEL